MNYPNLKLWKIIDDNGQQGAMNDEDELKT